MVDSAVLLELFGDVALRATEGYVNDCWAWSFLTAFLAASYGYDEARAVVQAVQCGGAA